jgi:hypothetical protein
MIMIMDIGSGQTTNTNIIENVNHPKSFRRVLLPVTNYRYSSRVTKGRIGFDVPLVRFIVQSTQHRTCTLLCGTIALHRILLILY